MGLAADPEQLVDGMADFIREVGYGTSFLDMAEVEKEPLCEGSRCRPTWPFCPRASQLMAMLDSLPPTEEDMPPLPAAVSKMSHMSSSN